jgi:hypothetical protein
MTITASQLDDLERKARAATPGPWITWDAPEDGEVYDGTDCKRVVQVSRHPVAANVEHIAANSPDVTLALIARIRELERTVGQAADLLEAKSDGSARREWAKAIRKYVANGVEP